MKPAYFVLDELRLADDREATRLGAAARLAELPPAASEQLLPMMVSIDDHRDVACVRRVRELPNADEDAAGRIQRALTPGTSSQGAPRYYQERAAIAGEQGVRPYYRMAVTESGANDEAPRPAQAVEVPAPAGMVPASGSPDEAGLLWIGTPVASRTGLLVITGHHDARAYAGADPAQWPLAASRSLGVRIYETARPEAVEA